MRLYVLGWLVLVLGLTAGYGAPQAATATPRPTPTLKACHICEEEEASPTPTPTPAPVVHFWFFYDSYCDSCIRVLNEILPAIVSRYPKEQLIVYGWDLARGDSEVKRALEAQHGLTAGEIPEIFIGDYALVGEKEIQARLGALIDEYLAQGGVSLPQPDLSAIPATPAATPTQAIQAPAAATPGAGPVVRAVLFWMSTCPHCHQVIENVLPPLQEKYGDQLQILMIEVTSEREWNWLVQVGESFGIPRDHLGVPFLVIGDRALLGSQQIPAELPGLIEKYLAAGGVDYPDLPGLAEALPTATPTPTPTPGAIQPAPGSQPPVVQVVMFWVNGCPHCHEVIDSVLPSLKDRYGDQLAIELVEITSTQRVDHLYQTAAALGIPREQVGVPFLVIGDTALIGAAQISARLPGLIEEYLAAGGVRYPDMPGLAEALSAATPDPATCSPATPCADEMPAAQAGDTSTEAGLIESLPGVAETGSLPRPNGFGLAIGVMVGMAAALLYAGIATVRGPQGNPPLQVPAWLNLAIPILALAGLGVAGYLAYVETQAVEAVCGPVGDCNAVQSSPYAKLFGVLPVGMLGAAGYTLILAAWLWGRLRSDRLASYAPLVIFGVSLFGVLFSLYLTYLEPFVIRAVCAWCLTSAVIITLLMLLSLGPALQAVEVRHEP